MTFQIACPHCGVKLTAKEQLIGQTRPCPKCKQAITIEPPPSDPPASGIDFEAVPATVIQDVDYSSGIAARPDDLPTKLNLRNKYLIVDPDRIIARWENMADGWQVHTGGGFAGAKRNADDIPAHGSFLLIELTVRTVESEGHRLRGLNIYSLPDRYAIGAIARGRDDIFAKIEGFGNVSRAQKFLVRKYLRERFMPEFSEGAHEVIEFLGNDDLHTHSIQGPER